MWHLHFPRPLTTVCQPTLRLSYVTGPPLNSAGYTDMHLTNYIKMKTRQTEICRVARELRTSPVTNYSVPKCNTYYYRKTARWESRFFHILNAKPKRGVVYICLPWKEILTDVRLPGHMGYSSTEIYRNNAASDPKIPGIAPALTGSTSGSGKCFRSEVQLLTKHCSLDRSFGS